MATLEQLAEGIRRANAKGDMEAVRKLGAAYRAMQSQPTPQATGNDAALQATMEKARTDRLAQLNPPPERPNLLNSTLATVNGLSASVPFLQQATDGLGAMVSQALGGDGEAYKKRQQEIRGGLAESAPLARVSGEIAGYLGGTGAVASTRLGAEALGLSGKFLPQVARSGASNAAYEGLQSLANGEGGLDTLKRMGVGFGFGAGAPVVTAGLKGTGRLINDKVVTPFRGWINPQNQATRVIGKAREADAAVDDVLTSEDEAAAALNNQPVLNVDRGGAVTRSLARTAANVAPEAKGRLVDAVQERFYSQSDRAVNFIKRITGGATDDLALRQGLKDTGKRVNDPAYEAAMNSPRAAAVWDGSIAELMQSKTFRGIVDATEGLASDEAAIAGVKAVRNPFQFLPDGSYTLKTLPDGTRALPSLRFWNQVKRGLDREINAVKPTAFEKGDPTRYTTLTQMKQKLVGALDGAVPEYAKARQGAAMFFGAENALDAGRKFATQPRNLPEFTRAHAKFSAEDKKAFAVGYASELIDKIKTARDGVNVIEQAFGSPAAREMAELALGPHKARELEAFLRIERIFQESKNAITGGSTTAQQFASMGVIGGAGLGAGFLTGDWQNGVSLATLLYAGRAGARYLGKTIDQKVMEKVAEMLASDDPKIIQRVIANAALSKQHMAALDAIMRGIQLGGTGAALAAAN